jgi:hypothetical protein
MWVFCTWILTALAFGFLQHSCVQSSYSDISDFTDLSDFTALVLRNRSVKSVVVVVARNQPLS